MPNMRALSRLVSLLMIKLIKVRGRVDNDWPCLLLLKRLCIHAFMQVGAALKFLGL